MRREVQPTDPARIEARKVWFELRNLWTIERPWTLQEEDRWTTTLARVDFDKKTLTVSSGLLNAGFIPDIRHVITHEVSHIVAERYDGDQGHGPAWKRWARRFGIPAKAHIELERPF